LESLGKDELRVFENRFFAIAPIEVSCHANLS